MPDAPQPWHRLRDEQIGDYEVFRVRRVLDRSPRTGAELGRFILQVPDWVNVIALTDDDHVVLAEQYRHGAGEVTLELPAGIMERGEDAVVAGGRELLEETGYRAASCELIGRLQPNPALQGNTLWVVLARGCVLSGELELDEGEDVRTRLVARAEVRRMIESGAIRHALAIAAWTLFDLRLPGGPGGVE